MTSKVAIIVLNYQAPAATLACLSTLEKLIFPKEQYEIHLVDNASGDHSVSVFQEMYPEIPVHQSLENEGYASGNNLAISQLLQRHDITHYWILNNDCEVTPDALTALMQVSEKQPKALVGSVIQYPDGRFQRVGRKLNALKTDLRDYSQVVLDTSEIAINIDSLTGCSWLIPAQAFQELGLLPEAYFLYYEDNAFCFHARKHGWQCLVATQSIIYHAESLTTQRHKPLSAYYYHRGRLMFLKSVLPAFTFQWVMVYSVFRLLRSRVKALFSKSHRRYYGAIHSAFSDFNQGIQGACPHRESLL